MSAARRESQRILDAAARLLVHKQTGAPGRTTGGATKKEERCHAQPPQQTLWKMLLARTLQQGLDDVDSEVTRPPASQPTPMAGGWLAGLKLRVLDVERMLATEPPPVAAWSGC